MPGVRADAGVVAVACTLEWVPDDAADGDGRVVEQPVPFLNAGAACHSAASRVS